MPRDDEIQEKVQQAYKEANGHVNVPSREKFRGHKLGGWLGNQRKAKKNDTLPAKRIRLLDDLEVDWWKPRIAK